MRSAFDHEKSASGHTFTQKKVECQVNHVIRHDDKLRCCGTIRRGVLLEMHTERLTQTMTATPTTLARCGSEYSSIVLDPEKLPRQ